MNRPARCTLFFALIAAAVLSRNPVLADDNIACPVAGAHTCTDYHGVAVKYEGSLAGVPYLIYVPNQWKPGDPLIMNMYGYWPAVMELGPLSKEFGRYDLIAASWLALNYAVAVSQSEYGWLPKSRVDHTERLRQHFIEQFGQGTRSRPSVISGFSMGGMQAYHVIETSPHYDGALAMCGFTMPSVAFLQKYVLRTRLLFGVYFPGVLNGSVTSFPDAGRTLQTACATLRRYVTLGPDNPFCKPTPDTLPLGYLNPASVAAYLLATSTPGVEQIPHKVVVHTELLRELWNRYGGSIFDNRNEIYPGHPAINAAVPRVSPTATKQFDQELAITGKVSKPVLGLHTYVDELVPLETTSHYMDLTNREGTAEHFVQLYTYGAGHCAFPPPELAAALGLLHKWIKDGVRPVPGGLVVPAP